MQILERGVRRELNKRANSKAASFEREGCVRVQNGRDACAFGGMLPCPRSRCTHTTTHTHTHTHTQSPGLLPKNPFVDATTHSPCVAARTTRIIDESFMFWVCA